MLWPVLLRVFDALDLRTHAGAHPRFGVVDVLPLVPYGVDEQTAREVALELAQRISVERRIPVHLYGGADPRRRSLPHLRRRLRTVHATHKTAGVVCIGVRGPLVAFNVNFRGHIQLARHIARETRTPDVRSLEFELPSRRLVQVSMNLIAPDRVGPRVAFDRVVALAKEQDFELVDCEVVGLVPHPILAQLEGLPLRKPARSIEQALEEKGLL